MSLTIQVSIPETLARALGVDISDLPRKAVEALAAQAYQAGRIRHAEVGEVLGLDRWQTDDFLKTAKANRVNEVEEFSDDLTILTKITKT